jgi:hypothetical protein
MAPVKEKVAFREIRIAEGETLFVALAEADHPESMRLLKENGLEPLPSAVALSLRHREALARELKGKMFYLSDAEALRADGDMSADDDGSLSKPKGERVRGRTVSAWPGKPPLYLRVWSDWEGQKQFSLVAAGSPDFVMNAVVGRKTSGKATLEGAARG